MAHQRYTAQDMIDALKATKGMVYLAAEKLRCNPRTVYNYIGRYQSVRDAWDLENGRMGDWAELKLFKAIERDEAWAIAFYLKTKQKHRGYTERQERLHEHTWAREVMELINRGVITPKQAQEALREIGGDDLAAELWPAGLPAAPVKVEDDRDGS